tara:strand:+ start:228 stop:680 length:453 start_codon:yes stop_codon:yes gene_type:complete
MKLKFCIICGTTVNIEHHHIKSLAEGGDNHPHNFITLCDKHHGMIHQIRPGSWNDRKELQRIGRERAKKAGVKFGMKRKYEHLYDEITKLYLDWNGYGTIGKKLGLARGTVQGIVKDQLKIVGKRGPKPIKIKPIAYRKNKKGQYRLNLT